MKTILYVETKRVGETKKMAIKKKRQNIQAGYASAQLKVIHREREVGLT